MSDKYKCYYALRNTVKPLLFSFIYSDYNCYFFFFLAKLDGVKTYMRMRRVPNHLQTKVIKWFDYLWLTQKCSDEEKAISCLPGSY